MMKIVINPAYRKLKKIVSNIELHFQSATEVLYDQRNQIKVVQFGDEEYVVKSFKIPNSINKFIYRYLRPSKAKRSYEYSQRLGSKYCPEAVAYIECYQKTLLTKSYYISKKYKYDFTIRPILLDESFDEEQRKEILKEFSSFTFMLHEDGILHNDYSYGNILIKRKSKPNQGDKYHFNIIDVNRMQFKKLTLDDRLRNFARLSANDSAMKTIMARYSQLIQMPYDEALERAIFFRDQFTRKKQMKRKLRGML